MTAKRLFIAILISLGLHLGAYGIWQQSTNTIIEVSSKQQGHNLNVAMVDSVATAKPVVQPTHKTKSTKQQTTKRTPAAVKKPLITKLKIKPSINTQDQSNQAAAIEKNLTKTITERAVAPETQESSVNATANTKTFSLIDNDMVNDLSSQFKARFRYPMLARKRGWQGEVVIALNINQQGRIDAIRVKKSSGYRILDANAIKTFKAIGAVSNGIQSYLTQSYKLDIPISYQLTGS